MRSMRFFHLSTSPAQTWRFGRITVSAHILGVMYASNCGITEPRTEHIKNLHLPLPEETYTRLRAAARVP
jgi:hypothetical protein